MDGPFAPGTVVRPRRSALKLWPSHEKRALQEGQQGAVLRYETPQHTRTLYAVVLVDGQEKHWPADMLEPADLDVPPTTMAADL